MEKLYYLHPTVEHRHRPVNNCEYISFPSWEIPRIIHAHDSTDSPFFFHGTETKGRESFVEYGSRSFLERRFNRSLLSRSVPPFLLRHPKLELRGKRARAKGKETVHYLETKKKKQLSTLEIRETLIFFDRSSSWKGGRRRKEKARSILWELNSPLSFEGGEE